MILINEQPKNKYALKKENGVLVIIGNVRLFSDRSPGISSMSFNISLDKVAKKDIKLIKISDAGMNLKLK